MYDDDGRGDGHHGGQKGMKRMIIAGYFEREGEKANEISCDAKFLTAQP